MPDDVLNVGDVAASGGFTEDGSAGDPDMFPRDYVEKLRRESASYRERAKKAEQYSVFESYDEDDRQVWLNLATEMQRDPKAAAQYMQSISEAIMAEYVTPPQEEVTQMENQNPNYITIEQFQAWQEQSALEAEVAGIEREAASMGYDVNSAQYVQLLWTAQHQTNGDLSAAHQALATDAEARWEAYQAQKLADAGRVPQIPGGQGTAPSQERQLKTWADAQAALEARIAAAEANR